jgi:hypothetical protein
MVVVILLCESEISHYMQQVALAQWFVDCLVSVETSVRIPLSAQSFAFAAAALRMVSADRPSETCFTSSSPGRARGAREGDDEQSFLPSDHLRHLGVDVASPLFLINIHGGLS